MSSEMVNNHVLKHHHEKPKLHKSKFVDKLIYAAVILMPLMTIPQIYSIWSTQSAEGVSIITWVMYSFFSCMWLWYGIVHKQKPIIINNILWIILQWMVVIGVLIY